MPLATNKPRVLVFSTDYKPDKGGISEHAYQVAKHLHLMGCKVIVMSVKKRGSAEFDRDQPFATYRVPPVPFFGGLLLLLWLIAVCKREKIGHVYSAITRPCCEIAFIGSLFCRYENAVVVHGYESSYEGRGLRGWLKRKLKFIRTFIYNRIHRIVAVSIYTKKILTDSGVREGKIVVLPNGVDIEKWRDDCVEEELIDRYNLSGKMIILTVGRLVRRKNHATVIEALDIVRLKFPEVRYLIAGEGPCEEELKMMVRNRHLESHVIFLGRYPQEKMNKLYNTCDIFVMPNTQVGSSVEGFGIVFLEANACRKPVIAGRSGGAVDAVVDGVTGFLVEPDDVEQLAGKIIEILSDPGLAERLGSNGYERVKKQFTWHEITSRMMGGLNVTQN